MKKVLFALALAVCTLGVTSAQQAATRQNAQNHQQCRHHHEGRPQAQRPAVNPFEGLELTEAQQTQIAALQARCCQGNNCTQQQCTENQAQCTEQNQQCNNQAQQCSNQRRQACNAECRTNCLNELKQILTPEQYVKFLENCFVNKVNCCKGGQGHHDRNGRAPRAERRQRTDRPQREARNNTTANTAAQ